MATLTEEIYNGLTMDSTHNLVYCASVLAQKAGADACFFVETIDDGYVPALNNTRNTGNFPFTPCIPVFDKAIETNLPSIYEGGDLVGFPDLTAAMCIPITTNRQNLAYRNDRRAETGKYTKSTHFVYFQKKAGSGVFNENFADECMNNIGIIANCFDYYRTIRDAGTDKLTGILNRKFLDEALDKVLYESKIAKDIFSVIMFDIDFFKGINDNYGHLTGDIVLRTVSDIVRDHLDGSDILGRYGGEEFTVILHSADSTKAYEKAEEIRKAIHNSRILGDKRDVTVSLGVVTFPEHGSSVKVLIEKADNALYTAKRTGRNKSLVWRDDFESKKTEKNPVQKEFFTGEYAKDTDRTLSLYRIMEAARYDTKFSEKIIGILQELLGISDAAEMIYFAVDDDKTTDIFSVSFTDENPPVYNDSVVTQVINEQLPLHMIDWDSGQTASNNMFTDWQSIAVVPAVYHDRLRGVLYAGVSIKQNTFTDSDVSYLHHAATIIASVAE